MPSHGQDVAVIRIDLSQAFSQAPNQGIDRLFRNTLPSRIGPNSIHDFVSANYSLGVLIHQFQQSVLRRREWGFNLMVRNPHSVGLRIHT